MAVVTASAVGARALVLELGKDLLDRVQDRAVEWQEPKMRAGGADRGAHGAALGWQGCRGPPRRLARASEPACPRPTRGSSRRLSGPRARRAPRSGRGAARRRRSGSRRANALLSLSPEASRTSTSGAVGKNHGQVLTDLSTEAPSARIFSWLTCARNLLLPPGPPAGRPAPPLPSTPVTRGHPLAGRYTPSTRRPEISRGG
jgi:hypothetical protein